MSLPQTIAIDGPVAAGKTAVGRRLAQRLGYRFLDTGALYRAATWAVLARGVDLKDEAAIATLASELDIQVAGEGGERVLVDGQDITAVVRSPAVERAVSLVARIPRVRQALMEVQRALARQGPTVVAGRDIGTHVLPGADLKVFLVASLEERTARRYRELSQQGHSPPYDQLRQELARRDQLDTEREVAPLRPAADASVVDTEGGGVEEVVARILRLMDQHGQ